MTALDLLQSLNLLDETERIEAKRASEVGKSLLETVCAFANEPGLGGGWLLLGVVREELALFPSDQVEGVAQPGYSLKSPEHLGEPGSEPRNPRIAAVLHETRFAETKGSGIRVMRETMEQAGLTPPLHEQRAIVEYIDRQTKPVMHLADQTTKTLELLKERRTALIATAIQFPEETAHAT